MKSISRLALIFILILCIAGICVPAAQAFETVFFATTVVTDAKSGETYDMAVSISGDSNAHIIEISLYYDPELVSISDLKGGSITEGTGGLVLLEDHKDTNRIIFSILMPRDPFMGEGELFTFKATLLREQSAEFRLEVSSLINMPINGTATDIPISAASGGLFVGSSSPRITPVESTPSRTSQVSPPVTPALATPVPAPENSDSFTNPYTPDGSESNDSGNDDNDSKEDATIQDQHSDTGNQDTDDYISSEVQETDKLSDVEPGNGLASDLSFLIYVGIGVLVLALVLLFIVKNKNK